MSSAGKGAPKRVVRVEKCVPHSAYFFMERLEPLRGARFLCSPFFPVWWENCSGTGVWITNSLHWVDWDRKILSIPLTVERPKRSCKSQILKFCFMLTRYICSIEMIRENNLREPIALVVMYRTSCKVVYIMFIYIAYYFHWITNTKNKLCLKVKHTKRHTI